MKRSFPILLYHHVSPDREITPGVFEQQLRRLLDQGYRSLSMDELLAIVRGQAPEGGPGFTVTFDDGYFDNWACAFPVLQKLGVKATYYVVTDRVEAHAAPRATGSILDTKTNERGPGGFLSWCEVRAMAESGLVEIGSHTRTHRHFVRKEPYRDLADELAGSKARIEKETGRPCRHLAWPWGDYETSWWPMVERAGYQSAVTTLAGANASGTHPFALKRISIRRPGLDWLSARLRWNSTVLAARSFGLVYGWDRRFKVWWNAESPYSHG